MAPLISTIDIARPPEVVFATATDPLRFGEWQRDVVDAHLLDDGRYTTTRRVGGRRWTLTQRVVRNEPPVHWATEAVDGPVRPHATITVEPLDGGAGSRVTFTLEFESGVLGAALVPFARRQAERGAPVSYRALKRLLESTG